MRLRSRGSCIKDELAKEKLMIISTIVLSVKLSFKLRFRSVIDAKGIL
jgi:hypothetical protein